MFLVHQYPGRSSPKISSKVGARTCVMGLCYLYIHKNIRTVCLFILWNCGLYMIRQTYYRFTTVKYS